MIKKIKILLSTGLCLPCLSYRVCNDAKAGADEGQFSESLKNCKTRTA